MSTGYSFRAPISRARGWSRRITPNCIMPNMGIRLPKVGIMTMTQSTRAARRKTARADSLPTSLADALFTTTQQRVLSLLFGQSSRSFFTGELIELTGSGSGAVQRELKRLVSSGLVTVTRIGKQKHYRANADSPVFEELCGLVLKTVAVAEPIRGALEPLTDRIVLALVYGSVAKGTDRAASDIDLLVVADQVTLEEIYATLAPVEARLDRRINPALYTSNEFAVRKAAGNAFLARVLEGEQIVLIGNGSEPSAP